MSTMSVTIDIDWACEAAIEQTINYFLELGIRPTVFTTHASKTITNHMGSLDVGLHPFFGKDSSHGNSISDVVNHVVNLEHNIKAFRCHRFATCNESLQAMADAGMLVSSNVCTNLELVAPFENRHGMLEIPIFLEDGSYLLNKHPLEPSQFLANKLETTLPKVILIHPMHFVVNTPNFDYMYDIKQSLQREQWNKMSSKELADITHTGQGIRSLLTDIIASNKQFITLKDLYHNNLKQRNHLEPLPELQI